VPVRKKMVGESAVFFPRKFQVVASQVVAGIVLVAGSECGRNNQARQDRPRPLRGPGLDSLRCAPAAPASGVKFKE
jgi:hypothetical protein